MADFDGPIGIADVRNAHPAAEPSGEDQVFALETVCIVLVKIMRSETDRTLVKALPRRVLRGLGLGKAADDYGLALFPDIDHPDTLIAVAFAAVRRVFAERNQQAAARKRQCGMRVAAVGRTPVDPTYELRRGWSADVEYRHTRVMTCRPSPLPSKS